MALLVLSFFAGVLTIAAPCILPLLPVIVGGSLVRDTEARWYRPLIVTASLVVSIVAFTLLLKLSTGLLGVPVMFWQVLSGGIVVLFGLNLIFPLYWEKLAAGLYIKSNKALGSSAQNSGVRGDILLGLALGPVFNSCSPTYALIVASILPVSFGKGLAYLLAYALGLGLMLLLVSYLGQTIIQKIGWLSNPFGWFRKVMGLIFIAVGLVVIFGLDKQIQSYVLEQGWYDPIMKIEQKFE